MSKDTQHLKELLVGAYNQGYNQGEQCAFQMVINAFERVPAYQHLTVIVKEIQKAALKDPLKLQV